VGGWPVPKVASVPGVGLSTPAFSSREIPPSSRAARHRVPARSSSTSTEGTASNATVIRPSPYTGESTTASATTAAGKGGPGAVDWAGGR
jgi:hypothetical protein